VRPPPPTTHEVVSKPPPPRRTYRPLVIALAIVFIGALVTLWQMNDRRPLVQPTAPSALDTLAANPDGLELSSEVSAGMADLPHPMLAPTDPRRIMLQTPGDEPLTPSEAGVQLTMPSDAMFVQGLRRRTSHATDEMLLYRIDAPAPSPDANDELDTWLQAIAHALTDQGFHPLSSPSSVGDQSRRLFATRDTPDGRQVLTVRLARRGGAVRIVVALRYPSSQVLSR
jgi:hypothetical protein